MLILSISEGIQEALFGLSLWLDSVVYSFINYLYKLFLVLAQTRLLSSSEISGLIKRVYTLIGVVMLFVLAYGLLNAIVNPSTKDKNTSFKTIAGAILSIVLIALIPTIFDLAYSFQVALIKQNTIGKLIFGNYTTTTNGTTTSANDVLNDAGINMAVSTFQAFVVPTSAYDESTAMIGDTGMSLQDVWDEAIENHTMGGITILKEELKKDKDVQSIEYSFILSTLAGAFLIFQLFKYCLSLGSRCIKLVFYELIAPAPILLSIIPSKKKLLSDWVHDVVTLFLEVFIRILVLYIAIYIIDIINTARKSGTGIFGTLGLRYKLMAFAILIMGLISFISSAPDLLGKTLGVDTNNLKKGIKDTLKEGGLFTAGAMIGGATTAATRNVLRKAGDFKNKRAAIDTKYAGKKAGKLRGGIAKGAAAFGIFGSGITSMIAGGAAGIKSAKDASGFGDMARAAGTAGDKITQKSISREDKAGRYRANNKNFITGRISDASDAISVWAGGGAEKFEKKADLAKDMNSRISSLVDKVKGTMKSYGRSGTISKMKSADGKTLFKGSEEDVKAMEKFHTDFISKGMGLKDIRSYIDSLQQTTIDRNDPAFKDDKGKFNEGKYQTALQEHTVKLRRLNDYYNQTEKATALELIDAISEIQNSNDPKRKADLIKDYDLKDIMSKFDYVGDDAATIMEAFKRNGGSVSYSTFDTGKQKFVESTISAADLDVNSSLGHALDKLDTAYKNVATENSRKASELKEKIEARKKESNK